MWNKWIYRPLAVHNWDGLWVIKVIRCKLNRVKKLNKTFFNFYNFDLIDEWVSHANKGLQLYIIHLLSTKVWWNHLSLCQKCEMYFFRYVLVFNSSPKFGSKVFWSLHTNHPPTTPSIVGGQDLVCRIHSGFKMEKIYLPKKCTNITGTRRRLRSHVYQGLDFF